MYFPNPIEQLFHFFYTVHRPSFSPDYKGEDLFDDDVTKMAGRDGWDDNKVHTEGDF